MDEATIENYRAKYAQWQLAARVVEQMRLEQGPGELNFSKTPDLNKIKLEIASKQPTKRVKDRR